MPKRTPLYDKHNQLGAKLIDFGGWEMPVLYTGISAEHKAVRNKCGLFDVSHMGEVRVGGPAAARFLNGILTNDVERLSEGEGQYTIFCNEQGGIIDDLFLFRIDDDEFLLVVNAARREVDIERLRGCLDGFEGKEDVVLKDISDDTGMLAIQGPKAVDFIDAVITSRGCCCLSRAVSSLKRNQIGAFQFGGESVWISRTGYTGEDGFEVLAPVQVLSQLWERLLEVGGEYGLVPVGLGARDTLRLEACLSLYGHELDEETTPIEAGLKPFVALGKERFNGREVMLRQLEEGVKKKLVAFRVTEKSAPPRQGYPLVDADGADRIGVVTSGTFSPTFTEGLGLAYVEPAYARPGTKVFIEIRGKLVSAQTVKRPFYKRTG